MQALNQEQATEWCQFTAWRSWIRNHHPRLTSWSLQFVQSNLDQLTDRLVFRLESTLKAKICDMACLLLSQVHQLFDGIDSLFCHAPKINDMQYIDNTAY